ncbi:GNAT family N-acetyltransferase [Streptomyces achromogenes]|uniref:GNAT family N-acetyltransferase n=1 Tax=Streptomyces achromogenes TaxID=67255 RepID=UPI0036B93828
MSGGDTALMTSHCRIVHTADLDAAELKEIRALLDHAFDGDFSDEDWDHGLGGVHALIRDDGGLAAHGALVMRRVRHRGRWLRTGYVEAVAVRADVRRTGLGGRVMAGLERVLDRAYDLGALSASDEGALLYAARGWQCWPGPVHALSPEGIVRLPDEEGGVYVRPAPAGPLDLSGELVFDWRDGDVT